MGTVVQLFFDSGGFFACFLLIIVMIIIHVFSNHFENLLQTRKEKFLSFLVSITLLSTVNIVVIIMSDTSSNEGILNTILKFVLTFFFCILLYSVVLFLIKCSYKKYYYIEDSATDEIFSIQGKYDDYNVIIISHKVVRVAYIPLLIKQRYRIISISQLGQYLIHSNNRTSYIRTIENDMQMKANRQFFSTHT